MSCNLWSRYYYQTCVALSNHCSGWRVMVEIKLRLYYVSFPTIVIVNTHPLSLTTYDSKYLAVWYLYWSGASAHQLDNTKAPCFVHNWYDPPYSAFRWQLNQSLFDPGAKLSNLHQRWFPRRIINSCGVQCSTYVHHCRSHLPNERRATHLRW